MTLPLSSEVNRILFDKQQKKPKTFSGSFKMYCDESYWSAHSQYFIF